MEPLLVVVPDELGDPAMAADLRLERPEEPLDLAVGLGVADARHDVRYPGVEQLPLEERRRPAAARGASRLVAVNCVPWSESTCAGAPNRPIARRSAITVLPDVASGKTPNPVTHLDASSRNTMRCEPLRGPYFIMCQSTCHIALEYFLSNLTHLRLLDLAGELLTSPSADNMRYAAPYAIFELLSRMSLTRCTTPTGSRECAARASSACSRVIGLRGLPIGRGSGGAPVRRQCARSLRAHDGEIPSSRATAPVLLVASVLATYRSARASSLLTGMARRRRRPPNVCFGSLPDPKALRGLPDPRPASPLAPAPTFCTIQGRMKPEEFNNMEKSIIITVTFDGVGKQGKCEMCCEWRCKKTPTENAEDKITVTPANYTWKGDIKTDCKVFLKKYVNVIYVPAEHETDDDGEDKKSSPLEKIIDDTIRRAARKDEEEKERRKGFQAEFNDQLSEVEGLLNDKLRGKDGSGYAPTAKVNLGFKDPDVTLETELTIEDGGNMRNIDHKYMGHGTKRGFYMAALEVKAEISKRIEKDREALTLVIIDEPELHQHPQRQKLLLQALQTLSKKHQVVYTTHSSLMITLKTPMGIRKVVKDGNRVKVRKGAKLSKASIRGRILKAMEEAIFASGIIVVEGYTDEVIFNTIFRKIKYNKKSIMGALVKKEVTVVACEGKGSIKHFYHVFESLGIKQFVVWDGDLNNEGTEARERNKVIVGKIGMKQEFLEELESKKDTYVEGPSCVCFGLDGTTYWAEYFGNLKDLKGVIKRGERIDSKFNITKFKNSDFYETVQNIRKYFDS